MRAVLAEEASGLIGRLGFQGAAWNTPAVPTWSEFPGSSNPWAVEGN